MKDTQALAKSLLRLADIFSSREALTLKIAEAFSERTAEEVVIVMDIIISKASRGDTPSQRILACFMDVESLVQHMGHHRIAAIYSYALENEYTNVERLFRRYKNKEVPASDGDNPFIPELEYMTLGEKKYKARTGGFYQLDKFAHDLSPEVIENLLKNPRTTERVVLKVASRRPSNPKVLEKIFKNEKWFSRYRVKKALAFNPYTPTNIAIAILNFLLQQDLKELAEMSDVHEEVKKAAVEILKKRRAL